MSAARGSARSADARWQAGTWMYIAVYAAGALAAGAWTSFHVDLNDFWGNLALARQVDLSSLSSLYNAFFPFGYALLLRLLGPDPVLPACLLSIAFGALLLASVSRTGSRLLGAPWALAAVILLSIHAQVFRYVTTPGPDIIVAALAAAGFAGLFRIEEDGVEPRWRVLSAGAVLGMAALLRYHALVFAGTAILATAIGRPSPMRHVRLAFAGLFAVYSLQMTVAVLAGHSPFHTGQAFIFYKLVHGVNWFHVGAETPPLTVWGVIHDSPSAFASAYLRALAPLWLLPLAPALLALAARDPACRRFGVVAFLTTASYATVVASGGSSRGSLPIRFLVALSVAALAREAVSRIGTSPVPRRVQVAALAIVAVVCLAWSLTSLRADYGTVKHRAQADVSYRRVEALLRQGGVQSAAQVFSSDLTLYFPGLPGYSPRTNGTWLRLDDGRYGRQFPELCVTTMGCLVRDAGTLGVTHVVLTPEANAMSAALGQMYDAAEAPGLQLQGRESSFRVFAIR